MQKRKPVATIIRGIIPDTKISAMYVDKYPTGTRRTKAVPWAGANLAAYKDKVEEALAKEGWTDATVTMHVTRSWYGCMLPVNNLVVHY